MILSDAHLPEVIRLYTEEELSLAEVGRRFNVSRQAIYAVLKDAGIEIRSKRTAKGIVREREIAAAQGGLELIGHLRIDPEGGAAGDCD